MYIALGIIPCSKPVSGTSTASLCHQIGETQTQRRVGRPTIERVDYRESITCSKAVTYHLEVFCFESFEALGTVNEMQ